MREMRLAKATAKAAAQATAEAAKAEAKAHWPTQAAEQEEARQTRLKLAPKKGAVLSTVESRHILMLYAHLLRTLRLANVGQG